jgi:hypothetical protein
MYKKNNRKTPAYQGEKLASEYVGESPELSKRV